MKPDEVIIGCVRRGEFLIDGSGWIWKRAKSGYLKRAEHKTPAGYLQVRKMVEGKRYHASAHRVVWSYFNHSTISRGMTINHRNGIKDDNRPQNLEMVTYSENQKHAHKTGLVDQFGQKNPRAKLSDREVVEIRLIYSEGGYTQKDLAIRYGVTFQTISDIVRGKYRTRQGGPIGDYKDRRQINTKRSETTGRFV